MTRRQVQDGIRLDRLMLHFKAKRKGELPSEGRSLLDMGFTLHNTPIDVDANQGIEETPGPSSLITPVDQHRSTVVARTCQLLYEEATTTPILAAIAKSSTMRDFIATCGHDY